MEKTKEQIQKVSVKCVIERDGKVLLTQDTKGVWELPGGRIDFGESPVQTAKRELWEELKIPPEKTTVGALLDAWTFTVSRDEADYQFILLVLECTTQSESFTKSSEHQQLSWFGKEEFENLKMRAGYKNSLRIYFNKAR